MHRHGDVSVAEGVLEGGRVHPGVETRSRVGEPQDVGRHPLVDLRRLGVSLEVEVVLPGRQRLRLPRRRPCCQLGTGATTPTDFGTLGGTTSSGRGINDSGEVAGIDYRSGDSAVHAVRWGSDNTPTDLDTFGSTQSVAYGINNGGWATGYYNTVSDGSHAALWTVDGSYDLNALLDDGGGWILRWAYGINDAGQIVGSGVNPSGQSHAFLLTPLNQDPAAVPEPSTLALLSASLLGGVGLLRRRRKA